MCSILIQYPYEQSHIITKARMDGAREALFSFQLRSAIVQTNAEFGGRIQRVAAAPILIVELPFPVVSPHTYGF